VTGKPAHRPDRSLEGCGETLLRCRGLVKRFGRTLAVAADLDVEDGHLLALLGPSGCGKTTLLRLIAGLETPDAGDIKLAGRLLNGPNVFVPPEKRRVSMVFQDFALFPHLDVSANISFGLPRSIDKRRRVAELLDLVNLSGLGPRMPHQLSGGQQQRVALARALAPEPQLILLDEPFSNLDPSIRARVRTEVKQLIQSIGITAIFVTHDQEEALSLAEHVAVMMEGRVLQTGTPLDVYTRPVNRLVGEFVGGANFLPGEVTDSIVECELGRFKVDAAFNGRADIMLRPESLAFSDVAEATAEVISVEYYGHDQMAFVRLGSGRRIKVRLTSESRALPGARVGIILRGEALAFPSTASGA
jgi:iron(III) transport system ATP-binding protein